MNGRRFLMGNHGGQKEVLYFSSAEKLLTVN